MNWLPIDTYYEQHIDNTPVLLWVPKVRHSRKHENDVAGEISDMMANPPDYVIGVWNSVWMSDLVRFEIGWESTGSYNESVVIDPVYWAKLWPPE